MAFTFLTYWIPVAGVLTACTGAHTVAEYSKCSADRLMFPAVRTANHGCVIGVCDGQTHGWMVKLEYNCAVNIVSDLASKSPVFLLDF